MSDRHGPLLDSVQSHERGKPPFRLRTEIGAVEARHVDATPCPTTHQWAGGAFAACTREAFFRGITSTVRTISLTFTSSASILSPGGWQASHSLTGIGN